MEKILEFLRNNKKTLVSANLFWVVTCICMSLIVDINAIYFTIAWKGAVMINLVTLLACYIVTIIDSEI